MQNLGKFSTVALMASLTFATASADPGCMCRYNGGEIAQGLTLCIKTSKGRELARCEKVLNLTSWKFLGEPCPDDKIGELKMSRPPQTG